MFSSGPGSPAATVVSCALQLPASSALACSLNGRLAAFSSSLGSLAGGGGELASLLSAREPADQAAAAAAPAGGGAVESALSNRPLELQIAADHDAPPISRAKG